MKKVTLFLFAMVALCWQSYAQTVNEPTNWPNAAWAIDGAYDAGSLLGDPTVDANFSYDDDNAGSGSTDIIFVESPVISLTAAAGAGETELILNYDYNYNFGSVFNLEYWDDTAGVWQLWDTVDDNSGTTSGWCAAIAGTTASGILDVSGFDPGQLSGFRYRFYYDASSVFGWGFCISTATLTSQAPPPPNVTCPAGLFNETYCYGDNDATSLKYESSDGSRLRVTFNSGTIEDCCDDLIILDSDGVTELYNGSGTAGDLAGLQFTSSGDTIYVGVDSDGSVSCGGDASQTTWDYNVECLACTPAVVDTVNVVENCVGGTYDLEITFSDLGDAAFVVADVAPFDFQPIVPGTFTYTLSGFTQGVSSSFSVSHSSFVCDFSSSTYVDNCPPANDLCADAIALTVNPDGNCGAVTSGTVRGATGDGESDGTCSGTEDDDVWYTFVATGTAHTIDLLNVAGSTTDLYHSLWEGACGSLTNILCSDPNSSVATGLTIGNTYTLRVNTYTATAGQDTTFDVCIGSPPANNDCAGAEVATVNAFGDCTGTSSFNTSSAIYSGTIGSCEGFMGDDEQDVWYSFTTNATTGINLEVLSGDPGDLEIAIYDACGGTEVYCDATGLDVGLNGIYGLTASTTYWLQVWTETFNSGAFEICLSDVECVPGVLDTTSIVTDCGNSQFSVQVDLTDVNDATAVTDGTNTYNFTGTTAVAGPYPTGVDTPTLTVVHGGTASCDFDLGVFNYDACPVSIDCSLGTPLNQTYCYDSNDTTLFGYQSSDLSQLKVTFNSGTIESCCDELVIYDSDGVTEIYRGANGGDLAGLEFNSSGDIIYVGVDSDGSVDCDDGSRTSWDWDVECLSCTPATYTTATLLDDCGGTDTWNVEIVITDIGSATQITDGTNTIDISGGPGTYTTASYAVGSGPVTLTVEHSDVTCDFDIGTFELDVCPPANDECADAVALTVNADDSCAAVTSGTINGATGSGESDTACFGTEDDDVWYTFVATSETHTIDLINVANGTTDLYHSLWEGTCGSLVNLLCSDPNSSLATGLTIGNTYTLRVYSWTSTPGQTTTFDVCIGTPPSPPANDDCANAIALTVNADDSCTATTSGTIESATADGESEASCSGTEDDDVWYTFVATSETHTIDLINVANGTTDLYHSLWEGTCGSLVNLLCSDPNSSVASGLTIGNTYTLRVYSWTSTPGQTTTFDVCIGTPPAPPANDECVDAIALTVNPDFNCGTVTSATIESATASGESDTACGGTEDDDVWFTFVATQTEHTIDLINVANGTTDLYHSLWEGTCGSLVNLLCSDPNSSTATGLTIGNTYTLRVYTWTGTAGQTTTFDVCIGSTPPPPANDDCVNAIAATVNPFGDCSAITSFDTVSATNSGSVGSCEGSAGGELDVWFTFATDAASDAINIEVTSGTPGSVEVAIYDACGGTEVACVAGLSAGLNTITGLTPSTSYVLQVWNETFSSGAYDLCLSYPPLCTPVNVVSSTVVDDCPNTQFFVEVVIDDLGDDNSEFSDGTNTYPLALGTNTVGPFTPGMGATLTVVDTVNSDCNVALGTFTSACAPANDDFANAFAINCGDTVSGDTTNATLDEDDAPDTATVEADSPADTDSPNVWYSFLGTGQDVFLDTCAPLNTDFDTEILIFTGTSGNLTLIDDAYDECGFADGYKAQTTFTAEAGIMYWISVEGYNSGDTGAFEMSVTCTGTEAFVYNDGTWTPSDPTGTTTPGDIYIAAGNAMMTGDTDCNSFTVRPGGGVTIPSGASVTTATSFLLESTSTNYSSLILDGTIGGGQIDYDRHVNINAGAGSTTGANDLISAPLTGQPFDQFAAANPNIYANPSDPTQVLFGPFSKTLGTFQIYTTAETAPLAASVGYRAASEDNSVFTFTGTAENGNISNDIQNSGPNNEEWNLIGNPYPSYMSALDFLTADAGGGEINITLFDPPTAAVWGYDGSFESWTIYNLATVTGSTLIAPGQGFFVSADVTKTAGHDVQFTPDMRRTGTGDDFIPGRNAELVYLKLNLSSGTDTARTDFYFNPNASTGFDHGYDAAHWGDTTPDFALYSRLIQEDAGDEIVLQALNSTDLNNVSIPLGVKASQGQQVTFSIAESTLPESVSVYLDDTLTNTTTLLNNGDYVITLNSDQDGIGRFFLRYEEDALSTVENNLDNIKILSLKDTDELVVNGQLFENTTLDLYDIQGRKVLTAKLDDALIQNRINVANLNAGVYVVIVQNNSQEVTKKVIIE